MKKWKESMRFISNRILLFGAAVCLFVVLVLIAYARLAFTARGEIWTFLVLGALAIGLILVAFFWIFRPYRQCEKEINRFLDGYLPFDKFDRQSVMLTPYTYQEIRKVNKVLNSTQVMNMNKRQAQYLALQNQINPHFLYNTLEGIRSEAVIAGLDTVADMTEALSSFFRYTISKVENLVSVEEELENCKTYFKIQQYRFGERLKLDIQCDPDDWEQILACRIPKLTLQPILENSIIHGTEQKIGTSTLTIRLERTETRVIIHILDDGSGMDAKTLEQLNRRLGRNSGPLAEAEQPKRGGIALVNVNHRIHLLFGEEYGMHVFSMEGVGTDVELTIPVTK